MKLLPLLVALPLALAAKTCTSNGATDPSVYKLTISADSRALAALSEHFIAAGKNVSVSDVLDSSNRAMISKKPSIGNGNPIISLSFNAGDASTTKWIPQGITSSADASASGKWEERELWIVSWHQDDDSNVRVSFVDREANKYRHVYLVRPDGESFGSVDVHAGGIVWFGGLLYVVDTSVGIRVFDMGKIWEVDVKEGLGGDPEGGYSAEGYRFVLPQIHYYRFSSTDGSKFRHSWISLDRTDSPPTLMVGEYQTDDSDADIRFVKYPLNTSSGRLDVNGDGVVTATEAYCSNFLRAQGGFSRNGKIVVSRSNGASKGGDMFSWTPGSAAKSSAGWFPPGNEDLSYNEVRKEWYTVTEHSGTRFIVGYDSY
ncbi:hypothetical protein BJY04DRAFT_173018 [Aspergillus karnatakaensis]|uniref:uncharacterized protein n=1 Tax=Aspergillus karnatakaensis TaxID=1810916 RepID=UPI003CCD033A